MLLEHDRKRKCTDSREREEGGPNSLQSVSVGCIPEGCPLMTHTLLTRLLPSQHCCVSKPSVNMSVGGKEPGQTSVGVRLWRPVDLIRPYDSGRLFSSRPSEKLDLCLYC